MAIEKMMFIDMSGHASTLDEVLARCLACGFFQPENASKLSEYSVGSNVLHRNPYGGLLIKSMEFATQLGMELEYVSKDTDSTVPNDVDAFVEKNQSYLEEVRKEYPHSVEKITNMQNSLDLYRVAHNALDHASEPKVEFDWLQGKEVFIRFGRLSSSALTNLTQDNPKHYRLYPLASHFGETWCICIADKEYHETVDTLLRLEGLEQLDISELKWGENIPLLPNLRNVLKQQQKKLENALATLQNDLKGTQKEFRSTYSQIRFLHDAYELRKYVVSIRERFHVVGWVLKKDCDAFVKLFANLEDVTIVTSDPDLKYMPVSPPIRLKNNWFVRPFEMFVNMYGAPSYRDIDPSPFVAYTYSLLFGIMFGDVGQGLCVALLGLFLWKKKGAELGQIMMRIGVSASVFGFAYGSVFGFEHLLDPFFKNVLGLPGKPIEVLHPDTTSKILIAAILIGAAIILMVILFNMAIGFKHRDYDRALLSSNGLAGLIFYSAAGFAAVSGIIGFSHFITSGYKMLFIVLPLLLIFFREPIAKYIGFHKKSSIIYKEERLADTTTFHSGIINFPEVFSSKFVTSRFGRLPTDSYHKLTFYSNEPFVIYPIQSSREYIWCLYVTSETNKAEIDAIFQNLYFERIYIPDELMGSNEEAESFIKKCIEHEISHEKIGNSKNSPNKQKSKNMALHVMFPEGFGAFLTQTFFEMFEVVLSFITNTMSFLRVGGFTLVHAGMMSVVFTLSEMVGGGASPIVIIIGNIFVMALEGLIVGIQVLRLEFYEIFSRFFDAGGELFQPAKVVTDIVME